MKTRFIVASVVALLACSTAVAQPLSLFTYGTDTVYNSEFVRVFLKNNSQKDTQNDSSVNEYLNLYINFKLMVHEAEKRKMDTSEAFVTELQGYRDQLAQSYLVDKKVTQQLLDEAYYRMQNEVNASHILVLCSPDALPKDTLVAYNKVLDLRNRIMAGESFDTLAKYLSEDPSARDNSGNLGYFSCFDMIYPFETQAYTLNKGEVSQPFRTQFGYHLLQVKDKRPFRGEIRAAHLMIKAEKNERTDNFEVAKLKADSLYSKLMQGANFEELVKEYSEDYNTKNNGGELNWISSLSRIPAPFKDAAFALTKDGEISKPVRSDFGWHIIKRLEVKGLAPKEEMIDNLKSRISRETDRTKLNTNAVVERVEIEENYTFNSKPLDQFIKKADSSVVKGTFKKENTGVKKKYLTQELISIGNRTLTLNDFAAYVEKYQTYQPNAGIESTLRKMFDDYSKQSVLQYEKDNLESKYDDFRYLMQEYHDGILLFNLKEQMVWNKAIEDTTGLKAFYEQHKHNYMWKDRVEASIYECSDKKVYDQVKALVLKDSSEAQISAIVNKNNPLSLMIKMSKFERGENALIDSIRWEKGIQYLPNANGKWVIVKVKNVLPAQPKQLNEIKGIITGEYQNYLEKQWITELRSTYPVVVDERAFSDLFKK